MSHPHILDGKWGTIARWADGETVSTDRLTAELLHLLANFGSPVVAEREAKVAALREAADSGYVDAASCLWLHHLADQIEREGQA